MGLAAIYLFIIMKLFNKINLAISIIKASVKCTKVLDQMKIIPMVLAIFSFLLGAGLVMIIIYAFSVGEIEVIPAKGIDGGKVKTLVPTNYIRYGVGYSIFIYIFWMMVILGIGEGIVTYAVSLWFFTK